MIAVAARVRRRRLRAAVAAPIPARILSIGSCSPISPVEQTKTSVAETPSASAVFSAVVCVFWKPCGPVQALAPPELRMTASTRPSLTTSRDQCTGAAATRLEVKTAAAALDGAVVDHEGQVRVAGGLEAGRDAGGAESLRCGDAHGATPCRFEAGGFRQAEGDVHGLHGPAGGPLGQVVDGAA